MWPGLKRSRAERALKVELGPFPHTQNARVRPGGRREEAGRLPNPDGRLCRGTNWALPLSRFLNRQSDRSQNHKGLESLSFHDLMACF